MTTKTFLKRPTWLKALRLVVAVVFVVLAMKAVRWQEMATAFRHSSLLFAVFATSLSAVLQCLSATRWWCLARASGMSLSWWDAVAAFYTGMFFNLFLPGLVGGDAVRAFLAARKTGHSLASSFGIVYADRMVGFIAMLLVGTWGAATLHLTKRQFVWQPLLLGALLAVGVTALMVTLPLLIYRYGQGKWAKRCERFVNGIIAFLQSPTTGAAAFAIALTYHLSLTATLMLLGHSVGIDKPFSAFAMVVAIATIIGSLPITLHGLGVREFASVQLWALLSVTPEQAMLWALLWRVMTWLLSLLGGLVYLLWADKTIWQDLQALAQSAEHRAQSKEFSTAEDPFTIPKAQRVEIAIATLEQMLEETEDETIRQALKQRLTQLREEQERLRQKPQRS